MKFMDSGYSGQKAPLRDPFEPVEVSKLPDPTSLPTFDKDERLLGELDSTCREELLVTRLSQFARRIGATRVEYYSFVPERNYGTCDLNGVETKLYRQYGQTMTVHAWFVAPARKATCQVVPHFSQ